MLAAARIMECLQQVFLCVLILSTVGEVQSLSYNPDDYLEVYPDPRDPEVLQGRTPLHFGLIQSLGGPLSQFDASGSVAGVKIALDGINNDTSLLPDYTLHYTFANSKCNRTLALDALHSQLFHEPKKLAIIGAGCSVATEPTAEVSHFYNITQMSCVSSSPSLSDRVRYPRYFQLLSSAERIAFGYYAVIREFGWRRIAIIVQDEAVFKVPMNLLIDLLKSDGRVGYNTRRFSTNGGLADLEGDIFEESSRIFILSMYRRHAIFLICEAYHRGLHLPRHLLVTIGWYSDFWWREDEPGLTCTVEEREKVLANSLVVSDEIFLDIERDADVITATGITVPEFLGKEEQLIGQPPLNITRSTYSSYCHDNTWILAHALNRTLMTIEDTEVNEDIVRTFNLTTPFRLEHFNYNNHKMLEIVFKHLANTSFDGLTGPVSFGQDGIRKIANLIISQFRNVTNGSHTILDRVEIGRGFESDVVNDSNATFSYGEGEDIMTVWNGLVPYDGVEKEEIATVHTALTVTFVISATAGIIFSIVCLVFNFYFRENKLIKLASTNINYLIGIGAIILYIDIVIFVVPTTDRNTVRAFCNLTPWLTAIGYSLCYGTILVKMARVYYIFNNPTANKKIISDMKLALGVLSLVAVDMVILITYTAVEGGKETLIVQRVPHKENPTTVEGVLGRITKNYIYICDSKARDIFLGILYGYKMLLQIIAILLAFSIRKVKVKGLDDAKYIGAIIYVTSIMLAIIIVATYSLKDVINGFAALFCTGFLVGTTVILMLVFLPLMVGLYKDPQGDDIFKKSAHISNSIMGTNGGTSKNGECAEMPALKKRIKDLEDEMKQKDGIIDNMQHQISK